MDDKFKLGKDVLIFSILTLITVLTWVAFEVYRASIKTTIPKVTQEQMTFLNPTVNTNTIETLKTRLSLSEEELNMTISLPVSTQSAILE